MLANRKRITIETYNNAAKNYQERFMEMDLYHDTFDTFCELIKNQNPKVFEIACGPGNVTKYLLSKRPDFKIIGIDLAPNMVELAKISNPNVDFQVMDCRDINTLENSFDAIVCAFCMPYLSKEECAKLIADASKLLNANGLFYFSTMEGNYRNSGFETTSFSGQNKVYIYYHQADYLSVCLKRNGFQILDLLRKDCIEPDGRVFNDMIFLVRKSQL